jgi:fimbrial isopeptide formation D2 family protein/LPXTG-motif cell wall-anchored protein
MKHFKRLFSYLVALTMVLSLAAFAGVNVHADTTTGNSLTVKNTGNTAHTFELYQIFTGDYSDGTLSNIKWGDGISEAGQTALGDPATKATEVTDATSFANEVKSYLTNATTSTEVAAGSSYKFDNLTAGYYLVKDKDGSQKDTSGSYTSYIVQVVGSVTQNTKLDVPSVTKKVKDTNDSTGATSEWQDSADYDIGDTVPYQITGTMPSNIDKYTSYKYVFTDTMSEGLTYTAKTATIKIGDTNVTDSFTETVTPVKDENGKATGETKVTWSCDNLKGISGVTLDASSTVVVNYNCTLNSNAEIGSTGNPNKVDLTYSNNPNNTGNGETGKTPEDTNIVFTYQTIFDKVNENQKALPGAGFTLNKWDGNKFVATGKTASLNAGKTEFTFAGLDDGIYQLVESTTPSGYNTMKPMEFEIAADHRNDDQKNPLTLQGLTMKKLDSDKLKSADDQTLAADVTGSVATGSMKTKVENKKGSILPSTGGMGTTLLYAAGGILLACAVAYVVLNKKHAK